MSRLAVVAIIFGGIMCAWHALLALQPRRVGMWIMTLPRCILAGRVLTALDVVWVYLLLRGSGIQWIERHQVLVLLAAGVAFLLIIVFMNDLLAVRALGGLFLLAPAQMLDAAFIHPSPVRVVLTTFAYLLVILGVIWVWSPFMLRKMTSGWAAKPELAVFVGVIGCVIGLMMIMLGLFVY